MAGQPAADERLPDGVRPSNWGLSGFLFPRSMAVEQRRDADDDDDLDVAGDAGLGGDSIPSHVRARLASALESGLFTPPGTAIRSGSGGER